jgi:hypothetical protein
MSRNYPSVGHHWCHAANRKRIVVSKVEGSGDSTRVEVEGLRGGVSNWSLAKWYAWAKNATRTYPPQREPDAAV